MEVICLEEKAFYALIEQVVERLGENNSKPVDRWIDGNEVMQMFRIKSTTTLQNLRDEGKIRFSQPSKKIILYDRSSIDEYLNDHAQSTF